VIGSRRILAALLLFAGCNPIPSGAPSNPVGSISATPTDLAGGGPCRIEDLEISLTNSVAAGGTAGGYLMFLNKSSRSCTLQGSPVLVGTSATGERSTARASNSVGVQLPAIPTGDASVLLEPGEAAFAAYGGTTVTEAGAPSCPPPYRRFIVSLPGDPSSAELPAFNTYLGQDQPSCSGLVVSVVLPAASMGFLLPLRP
jgi:hypothetical protein